MRYPVFIAKRYLQTKKRSALVSRITSIAVGGVWVGVATLVIVLSVINGFETELRQRDYIQCWQGIKKNFTV